MGKHEFGIAVTSQALSKSEPGGEDSYQCSDAVNPLGADAWPWRRFNMKSNGYSTNVVQNIYNNIYVFDMVVILHNYGNFCM